MFLINPYILQAGGNPLWNGLQAYYTADNTPNDALGTYNGTLVNGATYGTGIINNGFSLDGVNDYVDFGNNLDFDGTSAFSISCWVKSNALATVSIVSKMSSGTVGYDLHVVGGKIRLALINSFTINNIIAQGGTALSTGVWYNIVATYDGSQDISGVSISINGVAETITTIYNNLSLSISNAGILSVGSRNGASLFLNAIVDEVGIWNRELLASEVTELYNSGAALQYPN